MEQLSFDDVAMPQSPGMMRTAGGGYKCPPGCTCARHRHSNRSSSYRQSGVKTCTGCWEIKPLSDFDVHHQGANALIYHSRCKPCRTESARLAERRRTFRKYGITLEQFDELFQAQDGVCAICGKPEWVVQSGKLRELSVDHDHRTGKIRGLLCCNCNRALGLLNDDVDLFKRAINYLQPASA